MIFCFVIVLDIDSLGRVVITVHFKRRAIDIDETAQQIISTAVTNRSEVIYLFLCNIKLYLKIIRESYFYHSLSKLYNPFDD
jgi:hypothetical protein